MDKVKSQLNNSVSKSSVKFGTSDRFPKQMSFTSKVQSDFKLESDFDQIARKAKARAGASSRAERF